MRKSLELSPCFSVGSWLSDGCQVECLGDLQGPKFRVGELAGDPIELKNGDVLEFGICKDPGQQKLVPQGCRGERSSKQTQMLLVFNLVSVMEICADSVYTCPH